MNIHTPIRFLLFLPEAKRGREKKKEKKVENAKLIGPASKPDRVTGKEKAVEKNPPRKKTKKNLDEGSQTGW